MLFRSKLGDTADFVLIGVNVFAAGILYVGSDVDWITKRSPDPVTGACPDPSTFGLGSFQGLTNQDGSQAATPVPANQIDGDSTGYVVAGPDAAVTPDAGFLTVFTITKDATTGDAVIGAGRAVAVPAFNVPADAPQKRVKKKLDTQDARLTQAVSAFDPDPAHSGVGLWTQHTVFGGAGAEVRWYEIDPVNAALFQSGVVTSPVLYAFNGAVSPDRVVAPGGSAFGSDMVLGFNTSSTTTFPAIQMVSKVGSGAQSAFVLVKQSPGKNVDFTCKPVCRWGDYGGASPDPAASPTGSTGTVWLSNQWNVRSLDPISADWRTWNWSATP